MAAETPSRVLPESELIPSTLKFPVVGLGASAGGLTPLLRFFERMPADAGMAFVVVVHLSPKHVSSLPALLQATTAMRVVSAEEPTGIEAGTIYVIPPNKMLSMNDSYLRVTDLDRPRGRQVAIDLFFRTLAVVHRERAFAVVGHAGRWRGGHHAHQGAGRHLAGPDAQRSRVRRHAPRGHRHRRHRLGDARGGHAGQDHRTVEQRPGHRAAERAR